jgi:hypothetical protein
LSDPQANKLIGLPVAVGLEVARAAYKQLESFKQAQRSGYNSKRLQHGTLEVKYDNVKILRHPRQNPTKSNPSSPTGWLGNMYGLEWYGSTDDELAAQVQPELEMATMASLPAAVARAAARAAGAPVNPFAMPLVDPTTLSALVRLASEYD